ncbi:MAG: hypothetical protein K6C06_08090 [Lachnospiraceae bacterium]|nr:hypothetical protein [Lachnospiraceae bacterium]
MRRCERSDIAERYALAADRIRQIRERPAVSAPFDMWFRDAAAHILKILEIRELLAGGGWEALDEGQMRRINREMYAPILQETYDSSWGNPEYSVRMLGEECGRILCFLFAELTGLAAYVFEERTEAVTVHMEVFIEIYNRFEESRVPAYREIRQILYWFESDYCDLFAAGRVRQEIDPQEDIAKQIVMETDLADLRYLYRYGEYISDREISLASRIRSMKQEDIDGLSSDFAQARCRELFDGEKLLKGRTVSLWYRIGSERLVRAVAAQLEEMGLETVFFRHAVCVVNRRGTAIEGYAGTDPYSRFRYDHREDAALYLDKKFADRRLGVIKSTYECHRELAEKYAGAVLIETETDAPFSPEECPAAYRFSNRQRELLAGMEAAETSLRKTYLPGAGFLAGGNILTRKI